MAIPIISLFSDCYIACDGKSISLHKCVLNARAPALKNCLLSYDRIQLVGIHMYDDIMFAVKCIYANDVESNPTLGQLRALEDFGNDELTTKALSRYAPTVKEINTYLASDDVGGKHRYAYGQAIARSLRELVNTKHEDRNIIFDMAVPILKLAFSDEDSLTAEAITYIRTTCLKYMNAKMDENPYSMSTMSSIVYFMTLLV